MVTWFFNILGAWEVFRCKRFVFYLIVIVCQWNYSCLFTREIHVLFKRTPGPSRSLAALQEQDPMFQRRCEEIIALDLAAMADPSCKACRTRKAPFSGLRFGKM